MSKKTIILVTAIALALAGVVLCLKGVEVHFAIHKDGYPWYGPVGVGLIGFSFVTFVLSAFVSE
jgi:hypothetical protein